MIAFLKKLYYKKLARELAGCKTVLDVGCGNSSIIERIPGDFHSTGLDAYEPYLEESRQKGIHDEYICANLLTADLPEKSYDAVIAFDVVEHLERPDALRFLNNLERWAEKKIIVATPNGFVPTLECHRRSDPQLDHLQIHKSGWTVSDLKKMGYQVRGLEGFKWWRNKEGKIWQMLYKLSYPLSYLMPRTAFRLLAVKEL
ncbi:MAG: class I SAM-dependent methyltransferase [Patescibacteria group bacterium]|nr:class I SAM-dependent methyltransferase [Patescibacteria group bacterium]